jgi:hypothetical protein
VRRFNLKHAALKIDCEGCEYPLILNASNEALNAFDEIILEYHYGYKNLVERLKRAGFKTKILKPPVYVNNQDATIKDMWVGFLFAQKTKEK